MSTSTRWSSCPWPRGHRSSRASSRCSEHRSSGASTLTGRQRKRPRSARSAPRPRTRSGLPSPTTGHGGGGRAGPDTVGRMADHQPKLVALDDLGKGGRWSVQRCRVERSHRRHLPRRVQLGNRFRRHAVHAGAVRRSAIGLSRPLGPSRRSGRLSGRCCRRAGKTIRIVSAIIPPSQRAVRHDQQRDDLRSGLRAPLEGRETAARPGLGGGPSGIAGCPGACAAVERHPDRGVRVEDRPILSASGPTRTHRCIC
jgi:hypothetical protein